MSETGYGVDLENGYGFSFFPAYPWLQFSASQLCTNYHLIFNQTVLIMLPWRHFCHCCGFGLKIWFLKVNIYMCCNQGEGLVNWDPAWICILLFHHAWSTATAFSLVWTKNLLLSFRLQNLAARILATVKRRSLSPVFTVSDYVLGHVLRLSKVFLTPVLPTSWRFKSLRRSSVASMKHKGAEHLQPEPRGLDWVSKFFEKSLKYSFYWRTSPDLFEH